MFLWWFCPRHRLTSSLPPVSEAIGLEVSGDEFSQIAQINKVTGVPVPKNLSSLQSRKELHKDVIDRDQVLDYVLRS